MHAKPDLRVFLKWMIAGSGSVITDVIHLRVIDILTHRFSIRTLLAITFASSAWFAFAISHTQPATLLLGWTTIVALSLPFLRFQYWWFRDDTEVEVRIQTLPQYFALSIPIAIAIIFGPLSAIGYPSGFFVSIGPDIFGLTVPEWYTGLWENDIWWTWRQH